MSYDSYQQFAQAKAEEFDLIERERREFDEFNARIADRQRHRGAADSGGVAGKRYDPEEDRVAVAARGDAAWNEWFEKRFEQCLIAQLEKGAFLDGIFAEVFSILRKEMTDERKKWRREISVEEHTEFLSKVINGVLAKERKKWIRDIRAAIGGRDAA